MSVSRGKGIQPYSIDNRTNVLYDVTIVLFVKPHDSASGEIVIAIVDGDLTVKRLPYGTVTACNGTN